MKKCSKCKQFKEYSSFYKKTSSKDGFESKCKDCSKKYYKEYILRDKITPKVKVCRICKAQKEINHFSKDSSTRDGLESKCKDCNKIYKQVYGVRKKNVPKFKICSICGIKKKSNEFYKANANKDGLCNQCKDCRRVYRKTIIKKKKVSPKYKKCPVCGLKKQTHDFNKNLHNRDGLHGQCRSCQQQYDRNYDKHRQKIDPIYKIKCTIRKALYKSIIKQGYSKKSKTAKILGCDFKTLYSHLQQTFFNNYNRLPNDQDSLHIDHIIPLSTANTEFDVIKFNHYTNLQWLLAKDNLEKSDSLNWKLKK